MGSVEFITAKCPECGAMLNIEADRSTAFCSYCGAKLILHHDNEVIWHEIDDAMIKKAETDRIVKLNEMKLRREESQEERKLRKLSMKAGLLMLVVGIIMAVGGDFLGSALNGGDSFFMMSMFGMVLFSAGILFVLLGIVSNIKDRE